MARIVVAGAAETAREQLSRLLVYSGYPLFRCCASEGELRRAVDACEDGIVIMAGALPGLRPDELIWDCGQRIEILLIAKPEVLNECESEKIFRLPMPTSGQKVIGAVEMLVQLHQMRLPKREGQDREIVEQAKEILMRQKRITEPEAHRVLQKFAMDHGMKMADYAARIVASSRGME